jgi:hypothetical protein
MRTTTNSTSSSSSSQQPSLMDRVKHTRWDNLTNEQLNILASGPSKGKEFSALVSGVVNYEIGRLSWIDLRYMSQASVTSLVVFLSQRSCSAQSLAGILLIQICV